MRDSRVVRPSSGARGYPCIERKNDNTPLRTWLALSIFIVGLLVAMSAQAESYRATVKKSMATRLDTFPVGMRKLTSSESICGIGVQSAWDRTVVHVSDIGAANGLKPGDQILAVNGEPVTEKPANYRNLIQQYEENDKVTVNVLRNEVNLDIEAICGDDSERFLSHMDMLQLATKGKWQQCIDKSYEVEKFDEMRTLFSSAVRNTCTAAKRCGWKCQKPTIADAKSLYDVIVSELEAVVLANISIDSVRASVLNGISWLEQTGYLKFANDLQSRFRAANPAQAEPVAALQP